MGIDNYLVTCQEDMLHCMGYYKSYESGEMDEMGEDDQKGFIQEDY